MPIIRDPYQYQQDDLVRGAVKYLKSLPDVVSLVGSTNGVPWIYDSSNLVSVQNSQAMSIVVHNGGPWASPTPGQTGEFPKLGIDIWSDPPRDDSGQVAKPREARVSADWLYHVLDFHLNRTDVGVVMFGDVWTFGCTRLSAISYLPVLPSDDGVITGTAWYGVQCATFYTPPA